MGRADIMLLFLSKNSVESTESKREWKYWLNNIKKPLIPIILNHCKIPFRIDPLQRIDATSKDIEELTNEICQAITKLRKGRQKFSTVRPPSQTPVAELQNYFNNVVLVSQNAGALDILADIKTAVPIAYELPSSQLKKYILKSDFPKYDGPPPEI